MAHSQPDTEFEETVNKAAALGRAIHPLARGRKSRRAPTHETFAHVAKGRVASSLERGDGSGASLSARTSYDDLRRFVGEGLRARERARKG